PARLVWHAPTRYPETPPIPALRVENVLRKIECSGHDDLLKICGVEQRQTVRCRKTVHIVDDRRGGKGVRDSDPNTFASLGNFVDSVGGADLWRIAARRPRQYGSVLECRRRHCRGVSRPKRGAG